MPPTPTTTRWGAAGLGDFETFSGRAVLLNSDRKGLHPGKTEQELSNYQPSYIVRAFADESNCVDVPRARRAQVLLSDSVLNDSGAVKLSWICSGPQARLCNVHPLAPSVATNPRALHGARDAFNVEIDGFPVVVGPTDPYFESSAARMAVLRAVEASTLDRQRELIDPDAFVFLCGTRTPGTAMRRMLPQPFPVQPGLDGGGYSTLAHHGQGDRHMGSDALVRIPHHFYKPIPRPGSPVHPMAVQQPH